MLTQIDSLKQFGTTEEYVEKVKEMSRREWEVDLKENHFWRSAITAAYEHGYDPREIPQHKARVDALSTETIQETARRYFTFENYARFVLLPEASTREVAEDTGDD